MISKKQDFYNIVSIMHCDLDIDINKKYLIQSIRISSEEK